MRRHFLALPVALGLALAACSGADRDNIGNAAENAGDSLGEAASDAGDAIENTAARAGDAIENVFEESGQASENVGNAIENEAR